jgi:hypothetical protein
MLSLKNGSYSKKLQKYSCPYYAYNFPVRTELDNSFTSILTNSELYHTKPHVPSYKYTQLPSPFPHPQRPELRQNPPTQLPRSANYMPSVASPPIHPSGKHLHSTTSNITTWHILCSRLYKPIYHHSWPLYWTFVDILVGLYVCLFMLHSYWSIHAVSWRPVLQVYARRWSQKPVPRALTLSSVKATASSLDPFDA